MNGYLVILKQPMIILLVINCLLSVSLTAYGDEHQHSLVLKEQKKKGFVDSESLNHSIEQVLKRSEFTWRLPRDRNLKKEMEEKNYPWPLSMIVTFGKTLKKWSDTLKQWLRRLDIWFEDFFRNDEQDKKTPSDRSQWIGSVRTGIFLLAVLLVGMGIVIFWKTWRRRHKPDITNALTVQGEVVPDLDDENVKADMLPSDRWVELAQSLFQEGALPQAMRAFYLATLAHLSERGFITIRKYKSDGDYIRELRRRAYTQTDLLTNFTEQVSLFDNVWYGMHRVTAADIKNYATMQERSMHFVETA